MESVEAIFLSSSDAEKEEEEEEEEEEDRIRKWLGELDYRWRFCLIFYFP